MIITIDLKWIHIRIIIKSQYYKINSNNAEITWTRSAKSYFPKWMLYLKWIELNWKKNIDNYIMKTLKLLREITKYLFYSCSEIFYSRINNYFTGYHLIII